MDHSICIVLNVRIGSTFPTASTHSSAPKPASSRPLSIRFRTSDSPPVEILYAHQDKNPTLFQASVASGACGIAYAGVSAGGIFSQARFAAAKPYNATDILIIATHRIYVAVRLAYIIAPICSATVSLQYSFFLAATIHLYKIDRCLLSVGESSNRYGSMPGRTADCCGSGKKRKSG